MINIYQDRHPMHGNATRSSLCRSIHVRVFLLSAVAALLLTGCASSGAKTMPSTQNATSAASGPISSEAAFGAAFSIAEESADSAIPTPAESSIDPPSSSVPLSEATVTEPMDTPGTTPLPVTIPDSAVSADATDTTETAEPAENTEPVENSSEAAPAVHASEDRIHYIALDTSSASDSILIESSGVYMLVDNSNPDVSTGGAQAVANDAANVNAVIAYLRSLGVEHLDYMVLTHNHSDHLGGTKRLCEEGFVDSRTTVYYRCGWETADYYDYPDWENLEYLQRGLDAVYAAGANVVCLMAENITELALNVGRFQVEFLNLDSDHDGEVDFHYDDENENSIVLKATLGTVDTLLASDILARTEAPLADEIGPVEVLKAPHHGTESSSSYEFLSVLRPEAVVITCVYYIQNGAFEYLRSLGSQCYPTALATGSAIIENVWEDSYSFENAQSYDIPVADGIYEWFDYRYCMKDNTLMKDYSVYQDGRWYYFNEEGIMEP